MKLSLLVLGLAALALAPACYDAKDPHLPPDDEVFVYAPAEDEDPCARACGVLRAANCAEGRDTPGGATCERVCDQARGVLRVDCIVRARSLSAVRACNVRCVRVEGK